MDCSICYLHPATGQRDHKPICDRCEAVILDHYERLARRVVEREPGYVCSKTPTDELRVHHTGCAECRAIVAQRLNDQPQGRRATPEALRDYEHWRCIAANMEPPIRLLPALRKAC